MGKMVKSRVSEQILNVPPGVNIFIKARNFTITGPRGEIRRDYSNLPMDVSLVKNKRQNTLKIVAHYPKREHLATLRSLSSQLANSITGVTRGVLFKMRVVYAHFPINVSIGNEGKEVEIRNFLGEKRVRTIRLLNGVRCEHSNEVKEEIVLKGNDIDLVSRSAALICQSCRVSNKDIRKFLDGIYVSEKSTITS